MFDSEKLSKDIMNTFNSLKNEEQSRILSNCGLSFQKKQQLSTKKVRKAQTSTEDLQNSQAYKSSKKKELVHC